MTRKQWIQLIYNLKGHCEGRCTFGGDRCPFAGNDNWNKAKKRYENSKKELNLYLMMELIKGG